VTVPESVPVVVEPEIESENEEEEEEEMVETATQPCPVLKRDVYPQPVKPTSWAPYLAVSGLLCVDLCVGTLKKGSPSQPKPRGQDQRVSHLRFPFSSSPGARPKYA
jgi:hypothetical protein